MNERLISHKARIDERKIKLRRESEEGGIEVG